MFIGIGETNSNREILQGTVSLSEIIVYYILKVLKLDNFFISLKNSFRTYYITYEYLRYLFKLAFYPFQTKLYRYPDMLCAYQCIL